MYADSAKYYEGLSNQLKLKADSVQKRSSWQIKAGAIATAVGAVSTLAVLGIAKETSIEGGGAAVIFLAAPAEIFLFGGVLMMSFGAIDKGKVAELREQSDARIASRIETIKQSGTLIIRLDEKTKAEMRQLSQPLYDRISHQVDAQLIESYISDL